MALGMAFIERTGFNDIPEEYDGILDCNSHAVCLAFNRRGSLLAVGCNDGRIIIWDLLTRMIVKSIQAHAQHPVCSLSWSRNGQKIVSCSLDNTIIVWHVLNGSSLLRWTSNVPSIKVQFNPRNDSLILVTVVNHPAILLNIDYTNNAQVKFKFINQEDDLNMIASFDRRGQYIYTGNSKGCLTIFKCPKTPITSETQFELVSSFRIPSAIKAIEFGSKNRVLFLVNSTDRKLRLFSCEKALQAGSDGICHEEELMSNTVEKAMARKCCLSGYDKETAHVCAAINNSLYIYDQSGSMIKMLGADSGDSCVEVQWHPLYPMIVSISKGTVTIWARAQVENWSAYAPEFTELEENMEYYERESEFDLSDEDKVVQDTTAEDEEDLELDVEKIKPEPHLVSSDEEEVDPEALEFIPTTYEDITSW